LNLSDYARFYAGLSQLMVAMIFFQMTAVIVILGAELNRGIFEFKRMAAVGLDPVAARAPVRAR
jgi:membrane protein